MIAAAHPPFRASILPDAYVAELRIRSFPLQFSLPRKLCLDRDSKDYNSSFSILHTSDIVQNERSVVRFCFSRSCSTIDSVVESWNYFDIIDNLASKKMQVSFSSRYNNRGATPRSNNRHDKRENIWKASATRPLRPFQYSSFLRKELTSALFVEDPSKIFPADNPCAGCPNLDTNLDLISLPPSTRNHHTTPCSRVMRTRFYYIFYDDIYDLKICSASTIKW